MAAYIVRRIGISFVIIFIVLTVSFFLIRLMPGSAVQYMYYQLMQSHSEAPQQIMQQVEALYGVNLHQTLWQQYVSYLVNAVHFNFGQSILFPGKSVTSIIANAIPWTVTIVGTSLIISFIIGVAVGTLISYFQRSRLAGAVTAVLTVLNAVPNYIIALVLLYWFADLHPIFPIGGAYTAGITPGWTFRFLGSVFMHALLPILTFVITSIGGWALAMKSSVVSALGDEYVTAAHSRGLGERRILMSYVGRNAMLPLVTSLGISIGFMFGGSVFIETAFSYPGIGYYLITAVNGRDYPLMMGCFILATTAVVFANLLTDLIHTRLDPRVARGLMTGR